MQSFESWRRALLPLAATAVAALVYGTASAANPWDNDPNVQAVLAMRRSGIDSLTAGGQGARGERYSSTFVANTPANEIVNAEQMRAAFSSGTVGYSSIEQHLEYAASHGPDMVVLMGEEIVVPGAGMQNAGKRVHRRFTDVFRRENGEWRHDIRHSNVVSVE